MAGVQMTRWRRFGEDRIYVNDEDGRRVGWLDVTTGATMIERLDLEPVFRAAIAPFAPAPAPSHREPTP